VVKVLLVEPAEAPVHMVVVVVAEPAPKVELVVIAGAALAALEYNHLLLDLLHTMPAEVAVVEQVLVVLAALVAAVLVAQVLVQQQEP
jgi:hypothetical protein